jgi:hypothetical protein
MAKSQTRTRTRPPEAVKKKPPVPQEARTSAQQMAQQFRKDSEARVLSVPEGTPPDVKVLHPFSASADNEGYPRLDFICEDESEAVRQFKICYGIPDSNITVRVVYNGGGDPRPKPAHRQLAQAPNTDGPAAPGRIAEDAV